MMVVCPAQMWQELKGLHQELEELHEEENQLHRLLPYALRSLQPARDCDLCPIWLPHGIVMRLPWSNWVTRSLKTFAGIDSLLAMGPERNCCRARHP